MALQITETKIFLTEEERLKAYVTITLNGCFVIRDIKVIDGNNGLFVAMPAKKTKDGSFKDIAHPIDQETRKYFETVVLEAYQKETSGGGTSTPEG